VSNEGHDPGQGPVDQGTAGNAQPAAGVISLDLILNIFWRRRRTILWITVAGLVLGILYGIVMPPLYRATAQVRPGVVSYSQQGGPIREWQLKDIVRWFRTELYWWDMHEDPRFDRYKDAPVIDAEFIPQGPQSFQGGDIVLLNALAPDPIEAVNIIKEAIASFNFQATADTLGSSLHLTAAGARVRIAELRDKQRDLTTEGEKIDLSIAQMRESLELLTTDRQRYEMALRKLQRQNVYRRQMVASTESTLIRAEPRLQESEAALSVLLREQTSAASESDPQGDDEPAENSASWERWLRTAGAGELLGTVNELNEQIFHGTLLIDSLRSHIEVSELEIQRIGVMRVVELGDKRVELEKQLGNLILDREQGLISKHRQLEQRIAAERIRLDLLTPLQQIGRVTVTNKAVRPRRLRAASILTVLAFLSSLFVVLGWEYLSRNRQAITASAGPR